MSQIHVFRGVRPDYYDVTPHIFESKMGFKEILSLVFNDQPGIFKDWA